MNELLSSKELAARLKRSLRYVRAMQARGFVMAGGRTTLAAALDWLRDNPKPSRKCAESLHSAP